MYEWYTIRMHSAYENVLPQWAKLKDSMGGTSHSRIRRTKFYG